MSFFSLNRLDNAWKGMRQRERQVIVAGVYLLLVTALYLCFSGLWMTRQKLTEQIERLDHEMLWGKEQAVLAEKLDNSCARSTFTDLSGRELVLQLITKNRLKVLSLSALGASSQNYALLVEALNGDDVLRFGHDLTCAGFYLQGFSISESADDEVALFDGELHFSESMLGSKLDQIASGEILFWNWFHSNSLNGPPVEVIEAEELENSSIAAELMGVLVSPALSLATIKLRGQVEKIYHRGDLLANGVEIKEISPSRVVVEERGRLLQIPLKKPETLLQKVSTPLGGAQTLGIPNMFSAEMVQMDGSNTGLKVNDLSGELKALLNMRDGDVVVQVGADTVQDLMSNPALWTKYSANTELSVTIIRNSEEVRMSVNAFNLSAKVLPSLTSELMP